MKNLGETQNPHAFELQKVIEALLSCSQASEKPPYNAFFYPRERRTLAPHPFTRKKADRRGSSVLE